MSGLVSAMKLGQRIRIGSITQRSANAPPLLIKAAGNHPSKPPNRPEARQRQPNARLRVLGAGVRT